MMQDKLIIQYKNGKVQTIRGSLTIKNNFILPGEPLAFNSQKIHFTVDDGEPIECRGQIIENNVIVQPKLKYSVKVGREIRQWMRKVKRASRHNHRMTNKRKLRVMIFNMNK
jgi:hypothetical protein